MKKTIILKIGILFMFFAVGSGVFLFSSRAEENTEDVLLENQKIISGQIHFIAGNEIQLLDSKQKIKTYLIPVGTEVETKLGAITSFPRLSQGDFVSITMQEEAGEDIIIKIKIEESET